MLRGGVERATTAGIEARVRDRRDDAASGLGQLAVRGLGTEHVAFDVDTEQFIERGTPHRCWTLARRLSCCTPRRLMTVGVKKYSNSNVAY